MNIGNHIMFRIEEGAIVDIDNGNRIPITSTFTIYGSREMKIISGKIYGDKNYVIWRDHIVDVTRYCILNKEELISTEELRKCRIGCIVYFKPNIVLKYTGYYNGMESYESVYNAALYNKIHSYIRRLSELSDTETVMLSVIEDTENRIKKFSITDLQNIDIVNYVLKSKIKLDDLVDKLQYIRLCKKLLT